MISLSAVTATEDVGEVFRLHREALIRVASRITRDREAAEDVVQEVCLSALNHKEKIEGSASVRAYLFRMVVNKSIDFFRYKARWRRLFSFLEKTEVVAFEATDSLVEDNRLRIKALVNELPSKLRLPLLLAEYEELPYREIAEILNVPEATVKTRIFRAREKLRSMAEAKGMLS